MRTPDSLPGDQDFPCVPALCRVPAHRAPTQPAEKHDGLHPILQCDGAPLLYHLHVCGEHRRHCEGPVCGLVLPIAVSVRALVSCSHRLPCRGLWESGFESCGRVTVIPSVCLVGEQQRQGSWAAGYRRYSETMVPLPRFWKASDMLCALWKDPSCGTWNQAYELCVVTWCLLSFF